MFLGKPKSLKHTQAATWSIFSPLKKSWQIECFWRQTRQHYTELSFFGSLIRQWQWLKVMDSRCIWIYNWTFLSIMTFSLILNWLVGSYCSARANVHPRMTYLWSSVDSSKHSCCSWQPLNEQLKPNQKRAETFVILKCKIHTGLEVHITHLLFRGLCFFLHW